MRRWGKSCWRKRSDSSEACPRRAASGQACCDTAPSHEHVRDRRFETHPGFAGTSFAARDPDATGMSPAGGCRYETRRMCRSYGLDARADRSEEHTSELQSHLNLVCRLLLEK